MHRCLNYRGLLVEILAPGAPEREQLEETVAAHGVQLALPHRHIWDSISKGQGSWFFTVREPEGPYLAAFSVEGLRSRALPGHVLLRAERFPAGGSETVLDASFFALADFARSNRRVLRTYVEAFSPNEAALERAGRVATAHGFSPSSPGRCYDRTLIVDLTAGEAEIFASLHSTARRHIRAAEKRPVEIRPIQDPTLADRMSSLLAETLTRTGGHPESTDWPGVIELSIRHPTLSRLVGLFHVDRPGPESLIAFAWGCAHGGIAHYSTAASTREMDFKVAMAYPLAWDLICWARRTGASVFDFGGISPGTHGSGDPLGGISDFKRRFSQNEATVSQEWTLEPHRFSALLAHATSAAANWLSRVRLGSVPLIV